MDKEAAFAQRFSTQPPPYSVTAPPHSMPPVLPNPIPVYAPQHHHRHHPVNYGPESIVQTHVVSQQPGAIVHVVTSSPLFGPNPRRMVCTSCNRTVSSTVKKQVSSRTHLFALSLCLFCCLPVIPFLYCMDCCRNVNHYCPNCDAHQGTFIPIY